MIRRLKTKFILVSMLATFVVTLALVVSINLVHGFFDERRIDSVMEEIACEIHIEPHSSGINSNRHISKNKKGIHPLTTFS